MADNTQVVAGSGDTVRDKDRSGVKTQIVGLDLNVSGSEVLGTGDATNGLDVDVTRVQGTVAVTESGTWTVQPGNTANTTAWKVDGSAVTQPVSGTVTANAGTGTLAVSLASGAAAIAKAEDVASADADVGVPAMAIRKATPANTSGTDGDYEMLQVSAGRLWASAAITQVGTLALVELDAAGLTTATTAYTAGDQLGTEMSFTNVVNPSAGFAVIEKACLFDAANIVGAIDLYLFDSASTPAADNAANSWSDANIKKLCGIIRFPAPDATALNRVVTWQGAELINCAATTLFGNMITRTGHTFFGAATDIHIKLFIRQYAA